tara:strand:+ start:100 stop:288 length:189 start_codon:yes stop_codon:yes gene_type:complete
MNYKWRIKKGEKYYAYLLGSPSTTICWTDKKDNYLLFIAGKPVECFKMPEDAKRYYKENYGQ